MSDQMALSDSRMGGRGHTKSCTKVVTLSSLGLGVLASKSTGKHLNCYFVTSDGKNNEAQRCRSALPCSVRVLKVVSGYNIFVWS